MPVGGASNGYTGYIGVYRVYSITRVNMGTHKIYSGIQGIRDNISGSLYGDCHELLAVGGFTTVQKRLPDLEPRHLSDPFSLKQSLVVI